MKIGAGRAAAMDLGIGLADGAGQGVRSGLVPVFQVQMEDSVRGELAGQFAGGMSAHSVGDEEKASPCAPQFAGVGHDQGMGILVGGPPHADVSELPGPAVDRHVSLRLSLVPFTDVRVHGPPCAARRPARAPPLIIHA